MHDSFLNALVGLQPKWNIAFPGARASLVRTMNQPIIDDHDGLVIFGDSSSIHIAKVTDPGQAPYTKLPSIKATTFIHGWIVDTGNLYVLDGVELTMWNLGEGVKEHTLRLVDDADVTPALAALGELNKAIQSAEWAALLEQAEDEWARLTAQQAMITPPSDERDRLDALAADYFAMLKAMRKMVGSTGGGAAARQKVADLRKALADKRKAAAPWCFSPPVVRLHGFQEASVSVFAMQGNGTLHACDKQLSSTSHKRKKWQDQAELQIALLDEQTSAPKLVAYVSASTLYAVDAKTLDETSHWSPATPPAVNTTHSLSAANGQFWWSTDSGVYACKPDNQSRLQPSWQSGPPWSTRQVGRIGVPQSIYQPSPDPNDLFESMNVHGWIAQRSDKSAPLNDGMTAQLMLSDENGRYVAPPPTTTHVLYGPFSHDTASAANWGEVKAHSTSPLVLLSDSSKSNILCHYPTPAGISQLLPQWTVSPALSFVTRGSAADVALSQGWPAPPVRPRSKPQPDMVAYLHASSAKDALSDYERYTLPSITDDRRHMGDRDLRFVLWYALFNQPSHNLTILQNDGSAKKAFDVFYNDAQAQALRNQISGLGATWEFRLGYIQDTTFMPSFCAVKPPVDFDPPYVWRGRPSQPLFHKAPPAWYDPWGYNRPGDFVTQQPAATYFDPFCFDGQLKFPQRAVTLETGFKGRQWAVFADNDPASLQASGSSDSEVSSAAADPAVLVIRTDEDKQQTTFYVLPPKRLIVTYDAPSHELHPEALPYGSTAEHVLGCPTVFLDEAKIYPAAWCVGSKEYPSVRLRKIAAVDPAKTVSLWDTFVDQNKPAYGPSGGGTAWKIDVCPLPSDVLPSIALFGYLLPAH